MKLRELWDWIKFWFIILLCAVAVIGFIVGMYFLNQLRFVVKL